MAKKATTIILVIVVLFLLASTVYVSIILTSDPESTATTPTRTRASEIEDATPEAETLTQDPLTIAEEGQDPLAAPETTESDPLTQSQDQSMEPTRGEETMELEQETAPEETDSGEEPTTADESELLAYANPSPTGGAASGSGLTAPTTKPSTTKAVTPTTSMNIEETEELPETGQGQTRTASASPTVKPTTVIVQQQQQQLPQALPVAGSFTGPVMAFVIAGATIVVSFFL